MDEAVTITEAASSTAPMPKRCRSGEAVVPRTRGTAMAPTIAARMPMPEIGLVDEPSNPARYPHTAAIAAREDEAE